MSIRMDENKVVVTFVQIKGPEERPWKVREDERKFKRDWLESHINFAKEQLRNGVSHRHFRKIQILEIVQF